MVNTHFLDVWQADLRVADATLRDLMGLLTEFEKAKAASFKFESLRNRYLAVRGMLRRTLASYLDVDPRSLLFELGPYGKPYLLDYPLHFNLSHSGDTLLIAVADFSNIGIDIETSSQRDSLDGLAQRCFSSREYQAWRGMTTEEQREVFYRLWTKKEAFVKAVGRGIALGMELCEFEADDHGQLLAIPVEYGSVAAWKVHQLECGADYCAALVTPSQKYTIRRLTIASD